jgi:hypothetical protein
VLSEFVKDALDKDALDLQRDETFIGSGQ